MQQDTQNRPIKQSRFVRTSLTVAIIIVMNLFFNYTVSLVYNEPTYDQFVTSPQVLQNITTQGGCVSVGGQWTVTTPSVSDKKTTAPQGYCDPNYTNQNKYEAAVKIYDRNVFITLVILGIISIVVGLFVTVSVIPAAFSWAGVLSLVVASVRYWGSAGKLLKVGILACALGVLIWLAVKKFNK